MILWEEALPVRTQGQLGPLTRELALLHIASFIVVLEVIWFALAIERANQ